MICHVLSVEDIRQRHVVLCRFIEHRRRQVTQRKTDTRARGKMDTREQRGGRERDSRVYLGVLRHMCGRVVSRLSCSVSLCLSGRVATHVSSCRDVSCLVCLVLCLCVCRVCRVVCACGVATYLCLDITQSFCLVTHPCLVLS